MPNSAYRVAQSRLPSKGLVGGAILAYLPVSTFFYILLVLPFMPDDGKGRIENILFWPLLAMVTLALALQNWQRIDNRYLRSLPILSLFAYFVFAAASVTWAYSPDLAFSRVIVFIFATIIVVVPYAMPIRTAYTIQSLQICCALGLAISAVYVLTTPPTPIGHAGYFSHKQGLGLLAAIGIILSCHELLFSGWRRILALVTLCLGFWLVFASESKSALAFALISVVAAGMMLLFSKMTRVTPAYVVGAIVVASLFIHNPIERIGYRLYGDPTLTGRTGIWNFINYQISRKAWLGWGFHSYYFVPNSPQNEATGYIRQMPSSHSGYMELKLETGRIGYWIFLVFIYTSLHLLEYVRRRDPIRAWCYLSIEFFSVLINLTDSLWLTLTPLWILYLIIVAESVHYSLPTSSPRKVQKVIRPTRNGGSRRPARDVEGAST